MASLDDRKQPCSGFRADPAAHGGAADGPIERIFQTLILPQLTHSGPASDDAAGEPTDVSAADHDRFFALLTHADMGRTLAFLDDMTARGVAHERLLTEVLATAARKLGVQWEQDDCGFADVTIGMTRLHQALQHLSANARFTPAGLRDQGRALLAPCPGEQHNFGLLMLDEIFQRAGWTLRTLPSASHGQLGRIVSVAHFDLVGLSLSCADKLESLARTIAVIRRSSRNQDIIVLVGGRVFVEDGNLASSIGADAAPACAEAALAAAEAMMSDKRNQRHDQDMTANCQR